MHKSSRGSYSVAEPSVPDSYADIDQEAESELGPHNQDDYYQVAARGDSNGSHTADQVRMNGTSHKSKHARDSGPPMVNGTCEHAMNGFHDPADFQDSTDFSNLGRRPDSGEVEENMYIQNIKSVEDDEKESARYSVTDNRGEESHSNFESQGAKPKTHYNKNKNGLRDSQAAGTSWNKRQATKQNNAKSGQPPRQNYLNMDMEDMRTVNGRESREAVNWSSTADDEILEALKGPVLPPLKLPPEKQEHSCPAPKTPHIEIVYRKEDIGDEDLEELKFASRAVGFKINSEVPLPPKSSTSSYREPQEVVPSRVQDGQGEPSEGGILLMPEREATQHHEGVTEVDNASSEKGGDLKPEHMRLNGSSGNTPPFVDRTNKPVPRDRLEDEFEELQRPVPPPIPPRSPATQNYEATHEEILEFRVHPHPRSLSLPRDISPGYSEQTEDQNAKGNRRRVLSTFFGRKSKRHSTFSERPLPAIPPPQPLIVASNNISRNRAATMATERRLPQPPLPPEEQPPPLLPKVPIKSPREVAEEQQILRERGEFASSLRKISDFGWYWGPMSWDDAETRLENTPDGSFLVRDSSDERHILSLSFRANGTTHHTRIEHQHGKFSFWSQPTSHGSTSVVDFIEEAMKHSHNGSFLYFLRPRLPGLPPAPVQLLYAISRFQKARSLQHMCRFVIRKNIRLDHIDRLPLPKRLKDYLSEAHYYTPEALEP